MAKDKSLRWWGYLIAFAVLQFVVAMIVVELAYPCFNYCYNPLTNPISDLGNTFTSPLHVVFNASIVLFGILVALGVMRIWPLFGDSKASTLGGILLFVAMLGAMGVGFVPENTILAIHSLSALLAFGLGGPAAIIFGYVKLRKGPKWYAYFSIIAGLLTLLFFLYFVSPQFGLGSPLAMSGNGFGFGGAERLIAAPVLLWLIATSLLAMERKH